MINNLARFVIEELNSRGWSQSELARRAELNQGNLSRILSGDRKPGPDVCNAIARALRVPPETVFRAAGLLPALPGLDDDVKLGELLDIVKQLSPVERQEVLDYALWRFQRERYDKKEQGTLNVVE